MSYTLRKHHYVPFTKVHWATCLRLGGFTLEHRSRQNRIKTNSENKQKKKRKEVTVFNAAAYSAQPDFNPGGHNAPKTNKIRCGWFLFAEWKLQSGGNWREGRCGLSELSAFTQDIQMYCAKFRLWLVDVGISIIFFCTEVGMGPLNKTHRSTTSPHESVTLRPGGSSDRSRALHESLAGPLTAPRRNIKARRIL